MHEYLNAGYLGTLIQARVSVLLILA